MPYLILSVTEPAPFRLLRPLAIFDLGHVEILLCDPPGAVRSYGFYVSPTTPWRVLRSLFRWQRARVVQGRGFVSGVSRWKAWALDAEGAARIAQLLDEVVDGCASGRTRYGARGRNCFHLALECLCVAGVELPAVRPQWVGVVPALGARSFCRDLMPDAVVSSMNADLAADPARIDQWSRPLPALAAAAML